LVECGHFQKATPTDSKIVFVLFQLNYFCGILTTVLLTIFAIKFKIIQKLATKMFGCIKKRGQTQSLNNVQKCLEGNREADHRE